MFIDPTSHPDTPVEMGSQKSYGAALDQAVEVEAVKL